VRPVAAQPVAEVVGFTAAEARRLAYRQSAGRAEDGGIVPHEYRTEVAPLAPRRAVPSRGIGLPLGTRRLLGETAWPDRRSAPPARDAVAHTLLAAFGVLRREPSNAFNDHRSIASSRSRFPVHAFVTAGGRAWWLDPVRMAFVAMAATPSPCPGVRVLLCGRWADLPDFYGRLRGGLCAVESGIALRALAIACEALGVSARVRLAAEGESPDADRLGLTGGCGWSCPWEVDLDLPAPADPTAELAPAARFAPPPRWDEALRDVRRADAALRAAPGRPPTPVCGVPGGPMTAGNGDTWADVLWTRTAGRMPLKLTGYAARRKAVPEGALRDLCAWARTPPPESLMREAAERCAITVVAQDVEGLSPGAYAVGEAGELEPRRVPGPDLLAWAERCYGYPLAPANGCALRLAGSLWLVHGSPAEVVGDLGPGGWQAAQLWAGWVVHGICLAAAAYRLFARPALSFDEVPLEALLGLDVNATLLMSVTCGTGRFTGPMLDLRT
jgi:hypothetical protein